MRVLITGGRGFIGAWTTRSLVDEGHTVRVLDLTGDMHLFSPIVPAGTPGIEHVTGDVTDLEAVKAAVAGCEAIVHLAGLQIPACRKDPIFGAKVDVLGTLHVFEAAKAHGVRSIAYASSAAVYGPEDGTTPYPQEHYGAYKLANEGNARAYWRESQIASVGIRAATVYGPGREVGVTSGPTFAMRAAAEGGSYTIAFTGATTMDWVGDVAALFARGATKTPPGAVAFPCGGVVATMDDVVAAIREIVPGAKVTAEGPALPFAAHLDDTELVRAYPNLPRTSLAEGTRKTIAFYRDFDER